MLSSLGVEGCKSLAWVRQVHGSAVLPATSGLSGEGDGVWSRQPALAVSVVTADCVPILIGGSGVVAAVHAGWRGIEAGIVGEALSRLEADPAGLTAWIGPAIGLCCYEVGEDVAARIEAAVGGRWSSPGPRGRPHLDLVGAVTAQLRRAGLDSIRGVSACTRCQVGRLASYRRDGQGAGRNIALAWLESAS